MRRKLTGFLATATLLGLLPGTASAIAVTFNYTADNVLSIWGECAITSCASPASVFPAGPNASNWQLADTFMIDLAPGSYTFAFFVGNFGTGSSGNPAGFLADINWSGGGSVSSSAWDVTVCPTGDPNSCNFAGWGSSTEYGTNGGANIWSSVNGGPVAGISTAANWLWTANNFGSNTDQYVAFRTSISIVPEPGMLALLGLSLLALGVSGRKRAA